MMEDDDDSAAEIGLVNKTGPVKEYVPKFGKATVDFLFLKRLGRLMTYSGTSLFSVPHLLIWFGLCCCAASPYLEVYGLSWNAEMMGLVSTHAPACPKPTNTSCTSNSKNNVNTTGTTNCFNVTTTTTTPPGSASCFANKVPMNQLWERWKVGLFVFLGFGFSNGLANLIRLMLWWFWRRSITRRITNKYLRGTNPFTVVYLKEYVLDNPDQRITQDIDGVSELTAKIFILGCTQLFMMGFSSAKLYELLGWKSLVTAWGMAIGFSLFYYVLVRPISKYVFKLDHKEGDFRYAHARIREFAESIAFYEGEKMERSNTEHAFEEVISSSKSVVKWTSFFTVYSMLNIFLPYYMLVVINASFIWSDGIPDNKIGSTLVASSSLASAIMGAVSIFLSLSGDLGRLAGFVGRVAQLQELFYFLNARPSSRQADFDYTDGIAFSGVTCLSPQKNALVYDLNIEVQKGENVVVLGPSGCGKSSLLRALVGLWYCDGKISKPRKIGNEGIFYLPQKPYFCHGNLRQQLIYPDKTTSIDDDTLFKCLEMANIEYIHSQRGGWDKINKWAEILSPGEQQRLCFARLFYHKPNYAILDESTAALDTKNEALMYTMCKKLDITYISVGHRTTLHKFHEKALRFDGKGGYVYENMVPPKEKDDSETNWKEIENHPGSLHLDAPVGRAKKESPEELAKKVLIKRGYLQRLFSIWRIMHPKFQIASTPVLITLLIAGLGAAFMFAYSPQVVGNVSRVVTSKAKDEFLGVAIGIVAFHAGMACLVAMSRSMAMYLGVLYRQRLTNFIHDGYFSASTILTLNTIRKEIDNVDQRVSSDCGLGTSGFIEVQGGTGIAAGAPIIGSTIGNGLPAVLYFVVLNVIGVVMQFFFVVITPLGGWIALGLIAVLVVVVGSISLIFTYFIAKYTIVKSKCEGDFRHAHVHVREYAESIGFHGRRGVLVERQVLNHFFDRLLDSWKNLLTAVSLFGFVREALMGLAYPLAVMCVLLYLELNLDAANSFTSSKLFSATNTLIRTTRYAIGYGTIMVGIFSLVGGNRGLMTRVGQLIEALSELNDRPKNVFYQEESYLKDSLAARAIGDYIGFDNVFCVTPTGRPLNSIGVNVSVNHGDRLLLMGPSGCGKSSLLRVLSGLWAHTEGTVTYPGKGNILFLPQKAYMVLGTLRDQLIYPETYSSSTPPNEELLKYLQMANIEYILSRFSWDDIEIWNSVLSPGEQQRLSFARLFYHAPKFAVLDESTSALDPLNEDQMYSQCSKLGIGVISVGHRESLIDHHNFILKFDGKGGWCLNSLVMVSKQHLSLNRLTDVELTIGDQEGIKRRTTAALESFIQRESYQRATYNPPLETVQENEEEMESF